jgi:hypothetical protein
MCQTNELMCLIWLENGWSYLCQGDEFCKTFLWQENIDDMNLSSDYDVLCKFWSLMLYMS